MMDYDLMKITVMLWGGFPLRLIVVQGSSAAAAQTATQTVGATDRWKEKHIHHTFTVGMRFSVEDGIVFQHQADVRETWSMSSVSLLCFYNSLYRENN